MGHAMFRRCTSRARAMITEEMAFVAGREKIEPELVRSEIARGPPHSANIHHQSLEPMGIGVAFKCKINSNIGNFREPPRTSTKNEEASPFGHYGADTVWTSRRGAIFPRFARRSSRASPCRSDRADLRSACRA